MAFKRFVAATTRDAMRQVRQELGDEAVILSSKKIAGGHCEILAAAADAVDAIVETKRAEAIGQFGLFDDGDAGEETASVGGLELQIPLGEWDKGTLLQAERDMLGLYVSDHPLSGAERMLAQFTDRTIAAVLMDDRVDATVATVGGLVTAVQRKTTKQGSAWAIVTLEDRDEWPDGWTQADFEDAIREKLKDIPGINLIMSQPIAQRVPTGRGQKDADCLRHGVLDRPCTGKVDLDEHRMPGFGSCQNGGGRRTGTLQPAVDVGPLQ
jgi:hypothetical protein